MSSSWETIERREVAGRKLRIDRVYCLTARGGYYRTRFWMDGQQVKKEVYQNFYNANARRFQACA